MEQSRLGGGGEVDSTFKTIPEGAKGATPTGKMGDVLEIDGVKAS